MDYKARLSIEKSIFENQVEVHDLPPIFHYWSNKFLRPDLERFGFSNPDEFFAMYLARGCKEVGPRVARFASLGSGNCDTEVRVAQRLREQGWNDFTIECVDLNPAMLERGIALSREAGVGEHIRTCEGDFNAW